MVENANLCVDSEAKRNGRLFQHHSQVSNTILQKAEVRLEKSMGKIQKRGSVARREGVLKAEATQMQIVVYVIE